MMTLPNRLTLFRIILIPCFVICFYWPYQHAAFVACGVFVIAAITDWLDGYLARRLNQSSRLGAFLDPVADKLMVAVILIVLLQATPEIWLAAPVAVIIGREITVSALREWMAEIGARGKVAVSWLGKVKTTFQMIALGLLTVSHAPVTPVWLGQAGVLLLYAATILTLWSMLVYLRLAWPDLRRH